MTTRREKNNREHDALQDTSQKQIKDAKYSEENFDTTDSDAAENNPRIKQASQLTENDMEEGDEDYDDEKEQDQ